MLFSLIVLYFLFLFIAMEPQAMNYLTFHADKYNITQEQVIGFEILSREGKRTSTNKSTDNIFNTFY